jgi:hypothetical protein
MESYTLGRVAAISVQFVGSNRRGLPVGAHLTNLRNFGLET